MEPTEIHDAAVHQTLLWPCFLTIARVKFTHGQGAFPQNWHPCRMQSLTISSFSNSFSLSLHVKMHLVLAFNACDLSFRCCAIMDTKPSCMFSKTMSERSSASPSLLAHWKVPLLAELTVTSPGVGGGWRVTGGLGWERPGWGACGSQEPRDPTTQQVQAALVSCSLPGSQQRVAARVGGSQASQSCVHRCPLAPQIGICCCTSRLMFPQIHWPYLHLQAGAVKVVLSYSLSSAPITVTWCCQQPFYLPKVLYSNIICVLGEWFWRIFHKASVLQIAFQGIQMLCASNILALVLTTS